MRVLAAALLSASAVSAAKVADNADAPTVTGANIAARKAAETTAATTQCLKVLRKAINLNHSTDLTTGKFDPITTALYQDDPDLTSNEVADNLLGMFGGLCAETASGSLALKATGTLPDAATITGHGTAGSVVPTTVNQVACGGFYGSYTDANGAGVDGTPMDDANFNQLFGGYQHSAGQCSTNEGARGVCHILGSTSKRGFDAKINDGARKADSVFEGVDSGSDGVLTDETGGAGSAKLAIFVSTNTVGTKSVTGADLQTLWALQHSACQTAFSQVQTLGATVTAKDASAGTPFSVAAAADNNANMGEELKVARAFGYTHIGVLTRQLYDVYFKQLSDAQILAYAHLPWAATTLAHTDDGGAAAGTDMATSAFKDHPCMESLMKIYAANGASGVVVQASGLADSTKAIKATTLYDCISIDGLAAGEPCTGTRTDSNMGTATQQWGAWASTLATNKWGVPSYPTLIGSTMFTVDYPEFEVAASSTAFTSFACKSITDAAAKGSGKRARENACVLTSTIPDELKALSPLFAEDAVVEVSASATNKSFQELAVAADIPNGSIGGAAGLAAVAAIKADLTAGTTVRIITNDESTWHYKKAANLDAGGAATCDVVRAEMVKIRTERCDLGQALVNTLNAGSFENAFAIAYGKRTHHINSDTVTVPVSAVGWLPQLAADCGFAKKDAEPGATPNCTHVESHAGSGNARKTAFEDFKKNTSNKCNKGTNGAWSRFGAVAITAVLAAFAF